MEHQHQIALTRARVSRTAIEKIYVEMRHLVNRGAYRPWGRTGKVIREALLSLSPEIYGSMTDPEKAELNGLVYVIDRLPQGIEACRYIRLVSEEGYQESGFEVIIPARRRRNCYRIGPERIYIEVTKGRSEIYDILTHLTFLYIEAEKIMKHALGEQGEPVEEWKKLERLVLGKLDLNEREREVAYVYLSTLLGRSLEETRQAAMRLEESGGNNGIFAVVYWLGKHAMDDVARTTYREISFSPTLRQRIGHHLYGERWANNIKAHMLRKKLFKRPLHIISANMHSVMNALYAHAALADQLKDTQNMYELALRLSQPENTALRDKVRHFAFEHGMTELTDHSGTHISVQLMDPLMWKSMQMVKEMKVDWARIKKEQPVILVMDYAFGEQAFETLDELLKPYSTTAKSYPMPIRSISIMGKAGILNGHKGDIMVPSAHIFEGTADNYPFQNDLHVADFQGHGLKVVQGPMITVLGTSLQNRDILAYFKNSSWKAVGLEMEGAHYQKAIQSQSMIRNNIAVPQLRYAYYASDNPLLTGSTLASGSLGETGVKPAYLITTVILNKILG